MNKSVSLQACGCMRAKAKGRHTRMWLLLLGLPLVLGSGVEEGQLHSADQIILAFREQAEAVVIPELRESKPLAAEYVSHVIDQKLHLNISRRRYRDEHQAIQGKVGVDQRPQFIVYGSLSDLQRDGEGWVVSYSSMVDGFRAVMDDQTARVIVIWFVTEVSGKAVDVIMNVDLQNK